jgi:hypothetical protein
VEVTTNALGALGEFAPKMGALSRGKHVSRWFASRGLQTRPERFQFPLRTVVTRKAALPVGATLAVALGGRSFGVTVHEGL